MLVTGDEYVYTAVVPAGDLTRSVTVVGSVAVPLDCANSDASRIVSPMSYVAIEFLRMRRSADSRLAEHPRPIPGARFATLHCLCR